MPLSYSVRDLIQHLRLNLQSRLSAKPKLALFSLVKLAICGSLLLNHTFLQAQVDSQDDQESIQWYQVEVYIFANDTAYVGNTEHWPENVELQYPSRIVQLQNTGFSPAEPSANGSDNEHFSATATDHAVNASSTPVYEQQFVLEGQEPPFVKLDKDQHILNNAAARLNRQGNFRTLFHQAWRQPAVSREESTSVLIRGGDRFDDHFELEGSINLSVERYLHIKTDLWLSTFKSTAGLDFSWPKLPPLPITNPEPSGEQLPMQHSSVSNDFDLGYSQSGLSLLAMQNRLYQVDRTVVLRQSRRMRSEELHYLDHPLMGMLIKVIPYEPPVAKEELESVTEESTANDATNQSSTD